jgi:hypothetical protein
MLQGRPSTVPVEELVDQHVWLIKFPRIGTVLDAVRRRPEI